MPSRMVEITVSISGKSVFLRGNTITKQIEVEVGKDEPFYEIVKRVFKEHVDLGDHFIWYSNETKECPYCGFKNNETATHCVKCEHEHKRHTPI